MGNTCESNRAAEAVGGPCLFLGNVLGILVCNMSSGYSPSQCSCAYSVLCSMCSCGYAMSITQVEPWVCFAYGQPVGLRITGTILDYAVRAS